MVVDLYCRDDPSMCPALNELQERFHSTQNPERVSGGELDPFGHHGELIALILAKLLDAWPNRLATNLKNWTTGHAGAVEGDSSAQAQLFFEMRDCVGQAFVVTDDFVPKGAIEAQKAWPLFQF